MSRFALVFDLTGADPNTYTGTRNVLRDRGWDVDEQRSYYLAPDGHGLLQCVDDLHAAVVANQEFGTNVNSAHIVEFTSRNDVADLLRNIADALP